MTGCGVEGAEADGRALSSFNVDAEARNRAEEAMGSLALGRRYLPRTAEDDVELLRINAILWSSLLAHA